MYDQNLAGVYDLIYGVAVSKDYVAEAGELAELIRSRRPEASSLLDVACGTGQHLLHLRDLFEHVEGVELSADMRAIAAERLGPQTPVHAGDMRTFDVGRKFDAITCLFSSIGYVQSVEELRATLRRFAAHLEPGGVLVLEPWFAPDAWRPGTVHDGVAEAPDGRVVMRLSYSDVTPEGKSLTTMHYLYGEPGVGVRHWSDEHVMSLFTDDEYGDAFTAAGFRPLQLVTGWRVDRHRLVATLGG
ncbi:MAG TPA: methyltransferase domain-containing protein [Candidatus Limnocylindrales bacterium]